MLTKHQTAEMSSTRLKAPAVAVPTLRASTTLVGSGLFKHSIKATAAPSTATVSHPLDVAKPHVWLHDEGNTVFIDELVSGVQQFHQHQQDTKRSTAGTTVSEGSKTRVSPPSGTSTADDDAKPLRMAASMSLSPSSAPESRRSRSPKPLGVQDRKPWGFHQAPPAASTPRARPQSPHPQTEPRRDHHQSSQPGGDRSPAGGHQLKRSSSANNHLKATAPSPHQHVSPPTNRTAAKTASSPKTPGTAGASLSSELLSSLNFHVKSLDDRVVQAEARASTAEDKMRLMEKEMAVMTSRHDADMAATREKMLQLTAQLQYALHWINNFDTVAARQSEDAFLEEDCSEAPVVVASGRSAASGSVIRRLNLSTESATFRMPPSPPMTLEQK